MPFSSIAAAWSGVRVEQLGALQVRGLARHVLDRPPIQLERFAMRGQARGFIPTGSCRVVGELGKPGTLVVQRGVDLLGAFQRRSELPGARVVATPVALRDRPIQGVPQELMAEVVVPGIDRAELEQEAVVDELGQRVLELGDRPVHHTGQDRRHEASTDDGAGLGHGLRVC